MEDGVEHELQLRATRAQHGIETRIGRGKNRLRLGLHHPYRQQQPGRERDAPGRHERGERVLAEGAVDEVENHRTGLATKSPKTVGTAGEQRPRRYSDGESFTRTW